MTNPNDVLIRVPVSLLARLTDSLVKIRCIDGDLITGDIQQETADAIASMQMFMDQHNANTTAHCSPANDSARHFINNHVLPLEIGQVPKPAPWPAPPDSEVTHA